MEINTDMYKPNSHLSKQQKETSEERPKLEKVVTGEVKIKKKGFFSKLFGGFISDDIPDMKTYFVKDFLIPTAKKGVSELIDILLYGKSRGPRTTHASKVSYRSYYDEPRRYRDDEVRRSVVFEYENVVIPDRGEAEMVLSQLCDLIETYQMARVGDLNDLLGITGNYTDNNYGWTNLRNAEVRRVSDGYILIMPKALPLK